MSTVFITGVRGFIGRELAAELTGRGWTVRGSATEIPPAPTGTDMQLSRLRLGEDCDPALFANTDTIVHCAYDLRPGHSAANVAGTKIVAEAARSAGVGNQVFVSSVSAHVDAVTEYGRSKFTLEQYFRDRGACVVRLGLVVGAGGIFQRMVNVIRRLPAVPLIGGGTSPVSFVAVADVRTAVAELVEQPTDESFNLIYPVVSDLRSVNTEIMRAYGLWRPQIPIPAAATIWAIRTAAALGARFSITEDNVRAMRANASRVPRSDLLRFAADPLDLRTAVRRTVS